ncbi:hypothetical protein BZL29_7738 [Mycobacterium kansasii]|uniref:Uncharacterized protein n=1 Tax=Mycobacterium kansasii TaxID=1768 RepID=A0A1V3WGF5_MYCKA|nr:hypothetical protein BZL29_7738 [Mycobacterium kansasii]
MGAMSTVPKTGAPDQIQVFSGSGRRWCEAVRFAAVRLSFDRRFLV